MGAVINKGTGPMSVHEAGSTPERGPKVTDHRILVGSGPDEQR